MDTQDGITEFRSFPGSAWKRPAWQALPAGTGSGEARCSSDSGGRSSSRSGGILAVRGGQWFAAQLRRVPDLHLGEDHCQEDWGVVFFARRNQGKFWVGLSAWDSEGAWVAHFHHGSFAWLQWFSSTGKNELKRLLADFHNFLASESVVTESRGMKRMKWVSSSRPASRRRLRANQTATVGCFLRPPMSECTMKKCATWFARLTPTSYDCRPVEPAARTRGNFISKSRTTDRQKTECRRSSSTRTQRATLRYPMGSRARRE